ncbi:MAG: CaiB/BaiF CoA-transferase family protein [Burkholderiaceae bacterium]
MGPLHGHRIIELTGIGPAPMCGMMLAELGADVLRIDRLQASGLGIGGDPTLELLHRSRPCIAVDLKSPAGVELVLKLVESADALIEGFRPGVTERLGLGPEQCAARNKKLVYGRVTGWGQQGPLAQAAGHDMNYIALTGALHSIGREGQMPTPPLNLVGDFGGGTLYLALGVVAAMLEAKSSGQGQVVDAAMVDGAASLMTAAYRLRAGGATNDTRGTNILDTGAHFYEVYETSDGKYISLAPIEAKFYAELMERIGASVDDIPHSFKREDWPALKQKIAAIIKTKSRDEWCERLEGTDVCFAPVLDMSEAPVHPHMAARKTFVEQNGVVQPNAAPRFSRTPSEIRSGPGLAGENSHKSLAAWGMDAATVDQLLADGVIGKRTAAG